MGEPERVLFLQTLAQCASLYGLKNHAYCLMPNHYHLMLEIPRGDLGQTMAWLQTTFTVRFNRGRARSGHLFQGRFKAHLVDADASRDDPAALRALNPVRPRDQTAARLLASA